jgi:hypothetical protein|tara:strand:- start:3757 stop:4599 length:843 start_codon:yes stop_codon:yes gene_type:complete
MFGYRLLGFGGGSVPLEDLNVEYLVIAGGGGGGAGTGSNIAGGAGAGGYISSVTGEQSGGPSTVLSAFAAQLSTNYDVTVGAGGSGNASGTTNGSNSQFKGDVTAIGGGRGAFLRAPPAWLAAGSGGSGGGGAEGQLGAGSGTANQGNSGGSVGGANQTGGGGGGAGAAGGANGGPGGVGIQSAIADGSTQVYRAGGGARGPAGQGGGGQTNTAGQANTGGGGGEGNRNGGNGGSGVVILRYPKGYTINADPGHTVSTTLVGTQQVSTFTAGSGNITFTV